MSLTKKRNYTLLKKSCLEENSKENSFYSNLSHSFKKMKLLEKNVIVSKFIKAKRGSIGSNEDLSSEKLQYGEKYSKEYENMNSLLRNSYCKYLQNKMPLKNEIKTEKIIENDDVAENIFEYYKQEKQRLLDARFENYKKSMDLE